MELESLYDYTERVYSYVSDEFEKDFYRNRDEIEGYDALENVVIEMGHLKDIHPQLTAKSLELAYKLQEDLKQDRGGKIRVKVELEGIIKSHPEKTDAEITHGYVKILLNQVFKENPSALVVESLYHLGMIKFESTEERIANLSFARVISNQDEFYNYIPL